MITVPGLILPAASAAAISRSSSGPAFTMKIGGTSFVDRARRTSPNKVRSGSWAFIGRICSGGARFNGCGLGIHARIARMRPLRVSDSWSQKDSKRIRRGARAAANHPINQFAPYGPDPGSVSKGRSGWTYPRAARRSSKTANSSSVSSVIFFSIRLLSTFISRLCVGRPNHDRGALSRRQHATLHFPFFAISVTPSSGIDMLSCRELERCHRFGTAARIAGLAFAEAFS